MSVQFKKVHPLYGKTGIVDFKCEKEALQAKKSLNNMKIQGCVYNLRVKDNFLKKVTPRSSSYNKMIMTNEVSVHTFENPEDDASLLTSEIPTQSSPSPKLVCNQLLKNSKNCEISLITNHIGSKAVQCSIC